MVDRQTREPLIKLGWRSIACGDLRTSNACRLTLLVEPNTGRADRASWQTTDDRFKHGHDPGGKTASCAVVMLAFNAISGDAQHFGWRYIADEGQQFGGDRMCLGQIAGAPV